jgi:CopG family transcriptional regulator, nickel-responsive regulator
MLRQSPGRPFELAKGPDPMQRITISLDDDTARALDAHVAQRGHGNRSEAVRNLVREAASRDAAGAQGESCTGVLSYLFDHERRDLARRLVHTHHDHHALNLSTLHLHLDARRCLEGAVLKGRAAQLRAVADQVSAERGVRLGDLRLVAEAPTGA